MTILKEQLQEIERVEKELCQMLRQGHYIKPETYSKIRNLLQKEKKKVIVSMKEEKDIMSLEEIDSIVAHYEQKYGMSSEEFMQRDDIPDTYETMDWQILIKFQ